MVNKKIKNKKAQTEAVPDAIGYFAIALILILLVVFSVLFGKQNIKTNQDKMQYNILNDKVRILAYSLLKEKQDDGFLLIDKIREDNFGAKQKIEQQTNVVCGESEGECFVYYVFNQNALESDLCKNIAKNKGFCFFIPSNKLNSLSFVINAKQLALNAL